MPSDAGGDRSVEAADSAVGTDEAVSVIEEFLSVIASNWVTAMEPHLGALISLDTAALPEAHQVSHLENAHAVAAATMLAFALESIAARLAAVGRLPSGMGPDTAALDVIRSVLEERGDDPRASTAAGTGYGIGLDEGGRLVEFIGDWRALADLESRLLTEAVYVEVESWQVIAVNEEIRLDLGRTAMAERAAFLRSALAQRDATGGVHEP